MEFGIRAIVSFLGKQVFNTLFPGRQIHRSDIALKTYIVEPMIVLGETPVSVMYQQQQPQDLTLVIVGRTRSSLLGRNWLHYIKLDW